MIYPHGDKEWRDEEEGGSLTLKERWEIMKMIIGWKFILVAAAIDISVIALIVYLLFW